MENLSNINSQFVSYEIALALKELGYNGECIAHYVNNVLKPVVQKPQSGEKTYRFNTVRNSVLINANNATAPTWQQAVDWVIERYRLYIETPMYVVDGGQYDGCYAFKSLIKDTMDYKEVVSFEEVEFPTKVKALICAFNKIFELNQNKL